VGIDSLHPNLYIKRPNAINSGHPFLVVHLIPLPVERMRGYCHLYSIVNKFIKSRKEGKGMPSYEYRCPKCSKKFTLILSISEHDARKAKCPKCGGKKLEQLITGFQIKTSRKS
jgi:putative FmdB family regulatory protein